MPKAQLPKSAKGWLVAVISSMVGFFAGLASMKVLAEWVK